MINNIFNLFNGLFSACITFTDIVLFLSACCLASVLSAVFSYLLRGRY